MTRTGWESAPDRVGSARRIHAIAEARAAEKQSDGDLRESLAGLSRLVTGEGQQGLRDMLRHVAVFAVRAIPGADGASLILLDDTGQGDTVVSSGDFVGAVNAIQYGLGEGPGITATTTARTACSGRLGDDPRWPSFGPPARQVGVRSALSVPMPGPDGVIGAMTVYAHAPDAFDQRAASLGELFAVPAGIAMQNARALTQARSVAAHLQAMLTSRTGIDQTIGILMSRSGCTAAQAFDQLRAISQTENRKVIAVAEQILDDAVRRARARRTR